LTTPDPEQFSGTVNSICIGREARAENLIFTSLPLVVENRVVGTHPQKLQ
jgi:hypothetical protein